jgi:hypothetical protein
MAADSSRIPRFLAYPPGNINGLSLPSAMATLDDVQSQWWFLVGLLQERSGAVHSFELSVIDTQILSLAVVDFDFTFDRDGGANSKGGRSFHVTSTYGGERLTDWLDAFGNCLGRVQASGADNAFSLAVSSLQPVGPKVSVIYDPAGSSPKPAMYSGFVGQPGAQYQVTASGRAFLTQYSAESVSPSALYAYELKLTVIDERGLVGEGWGAYVGIDPSAGSRDTTGNISVEYAMPCLHVKSWTVTLKPYAGISGETFTFANDVRKGSLWLDRQALHPQATASGGQSSTLTMLGKGVRMEIARLVASIYGAADPSIEAGSSGPDEGIGKRLAAAIPCGAERTIMPQLYRGCWLALSIDDGPYTGVSGDFVAFWNKARAVADYDTDRRDAGGGFMNLYLGILQDQARYDPVSAYTVTDALVPGPGPGRLPYRIQFTEQFQKIGDLPDPQRWAKTIQITVKGGTQARYALAAYARRADRHEAQSVDEDVVFTLRAASPYTTTTPISTCISPPVYEGAATLHDERGNTIGTAWVEQMVGDPGERAPEKV